MSKEDIYIDLMERYPGLTPEIISDMNPYVQYALQRGKKIQTLDGEAAAKFLQNRQR